MSSQTSNPNTGVGRLNTELLGAAAALGGPAIMLAQGAKATDVAAQTLKDSALVSLLGPTALFATGMLGILATIKKIVGETGLLNRGLKQVAALEQIEGKFETLLKSATLAKQRIKELYDFTANSPFKFNDVAEANRILQALSGGALAGAAGMRLVGDAAAATGQDMASVAQGVGKLYNALSSGRSLDRIIFQMMQTGLITDKTARQLEDLEARGAGFAETWGVVESALKRTTGGMANESRTLEGLAMRLASVSEQLERAVAAPFRDAQGKKLEIQIRATENLTPVLAKISKDLSPVLVLTDMFKNTLTQSTLASKGFASALEGVWGMLKLIGTGTAFATLGTLAKQLGSASKFVISTTRGAVAAVAASKQGGRLADAGSAFRGARNAAAAGDIIGAGAGAARAAAEAGRGVGEVIHQQGKQAVKPLVTEAVLSAGKEARTKVYADGGAAAKAIQLRRAAAAAQSSGAAENVVKGLLAQAAAERALAAATIARARASAAAAASTSVQAAGTYVAATGTTVLAGAAGVAKKAIVGLGNAMISSVKALLSTPFTRILFGIGSVVTGYLAWKRAVDDAAAEYESLQNEISATNKKLEEQRASVRTVEDWVQSVNDLTEAYGKARGALEAFQTKQERTDRNPVARAMQAVKDVVVTGSKVSREGQGIMLRQQVERLQNERNMQARRGEFTGQSGREREDAEAKLQTQEQLREQKFRQSLENSSGEVQNKRLEEHITLLREEAAAGQAVTDAFNKTQRSEKPKNQELRDQQINELNAREAAKAEGLTDVDLTDPAKKLAEVQKRIVELEQVQKAPTTGPGKSLATQLATFGTPEIAGKAAGATPQDDGDLPTVSQQITKLKDQAELLTKVTTAQESQKRIKSELEAFRRGPQSDRLTQLSQQKEDLFTEQEAEVKAGKQPSLRTLVERQTKLRAIEQEEVELLQKQKSIGPKQVQAQQEEAELKNNKRMQALKAEELAWDKKIVEARLRGEETVTLEMEKQLALLKKQLDLAPGGPADRREAEKERQAKLAEARKLRDDVTPTAPKQKAERDQKIADLERQRDQLAPSKERDFVEAQLESHRAARKRDEEREARITPEKRAENLAKAKGIEEANRTKQQELRDVRSVLDRDNPKKRQQVQRELDELVTKRKSLGTEEIDTKISEKQTELKESREQNRQQVRKELDELITQKKSLSTQELDTQIAAKQAELGKSRFDPEKRPQVQRELDELVTRREAVATRGQEIDTKIAAKQVELKQDRDDPVLQRELSELVTQRKSLGAEKLDAQITAKRAELQPPLTPEGRKALEERATVLSQRIRKDERGESDTPDEDARTRVEVQRLTAEKDASKRALATEETFARFAKEGPEGEKKAAALKTALAVKAEFERIAPGGGTLEQAKENIKTKVETEEKARQDAEKASIPKNALGLESQALNQLSPSDAAAKALLDATVAGNRILMDIEAAVKSGGTMK